MYDYCIVITTAAPPPPAAVIIISRASSTAAIPVKKEPSGLAHKEGKRPDGCTLIPWRGGKPLAWDVTVCTTVADSYLTAVSHAAGGAVAEQAADRKCLK